ncbi:MAG: hypothetical protein DLM60_17225 [Pseudonocardiales bacterium]|nr:MAG: hypothetical protein DLM60_17225 [Pseudonocardiales bacterium]
MPGVSELSFKTLRTWNGEQSRAFEELSFQLLKDWVPAGTQAIRTGNPDGGVEWYATLSDGTEWGWQVKHVEGIDALLTAMTGSVERVAKERPDLDDPYIVQRVVVIAYGSVLRSSQEQADQAKALAELVHSLVFTRPIRPDELLLDAARGIVRWAVAHELLPASTLGSSRRPYGLKVPGPPPLEATIKAKYGWRKDQPADESYSSIDFSLMGMGDFARYVVEPGVRQFSRYRIGQPYPEWQRREPRFVKSRWQTLLLH